MCQCDGLMGSFGSFACGSHVCQLAKCRFKLTIVRFLVFVIIFAALYFAINDQIKPWVQLSLIMRMVFYSNYIYSGRVSYWLRLQPIESKINHTAAHYFPVDVNDTDGLGHLYHQLDYMTEAYHNPRNRTVKYILRVGGFNWEDWLEGRERFFVDDCPIKDCWLTSDISKAHTANALLISQIDHESVEAYLPKPSNQIWIARHRESPLHDRIDSTSLSGLLNWTATYRRESTFFLPYHVPYGRKDRLHPMWHHHDPAVKTRPPGPDGLYSSVNFAAGKTKKVAWFVSNCYDRNGRLNYVYELAKHIDVDIYGDCGKLSCPKSKCRSMLSHTYKFYLALENSNCVGYITEKFVFQALLSDILPIVMGALPEDYLAIAPPHSYIHVDDFRSPRHLAKYLHYLDTNDAAYNEYFKWKDTWTAVTDKYWCRLCAALHMADDVGHSSYFPDYSAWWNEACSARVSSEGWWLTWRPEGFWESTTASTVTY